MQRRNTPWTARQQRHLAYISEFTSSIVHVPGMKNTVADALSRPSQCSSAPAPSQPPPTTVSPPLLNPALPQLQAPSPSHDAPNPSPTEDPASEVSGVSALSEVLEVSAVTAVTVSPPPSTVLQYFSIPNFDFSKILSLQQVCSSVSDMKNISSLSIVTVTLDSGDLLCDNLTGTLRPLVPEVLRKSLFLALHNVSHPGVRGSRRLISARFVWPG